MIAESATLSRLNLMEHGPSWETGGGGGRQVEGEGDRWRGRETGGGGGRQGEGEGDRGRGRETGGGGGRQGEGEGAQAITHTYMYIDTCIWIMIDYYRDTHIHVFK